MFATRDSLLVAVSGLVFAIVLLATVAGGAGSAEAPWKSIYSGEEATGAHVIALWQFQPGKEAEDNSGHGHALTPRGKTRFAEGGLFGNCLDIPSAAVAGEDIALGALVHNHADLTPQDTFTLELWIRPRLELYAQSTAFLLDKKYFHYARAGADANADYCLFLRKVDNKQVHLAAGLGYGENSDFLNSDPVQLVPGSWYHVAFTYDGAGVGRFFLDGKPVGGKTFPGRGAISAGWRPLVIGDRYGSSHWRFPGSISQVRISRGIPAFLGGPSATISPAGDARGHLTPVSGNWRAEKDRVLEMSDSADEAKRPLFATFKGEAADNILVTADFETYDGAGEVLVIPAWTDADNYVAAVWVDANVVRLVQVRGGEETILAEKQLQGVQLPARLGAAISGQGLRAYVNGELALESGALFKATRVRALGGRYRSIGFRHVKEEAVPHWTSPQAAFCPVKLECPAGRSLFYRMEKGAAMALAVRNLTKERLSSVKVRVTIEGRPGSATEQILKDIAPEAMVTFTCPVPSDRLRPDSYMVSIRAEPAGWKPAEARFSFTVIRRPNANRFPVLMWGSVPDATLPRLAELGFTAVFAAGADFKHLWDNPESTDSHDFDSNPSLRQSIATSIENIMGAGMEAAANFSPGMWMIYNRPELTRIMRDGSRLNPNRPDICPLLPEVKPFCVRATEALKRTYAQFPPFTMVNLHTELRDNAQPCFHPVDIEAYRKATGQEIPPEVIRKDIVNYKTLPGFPADRIVPDDHPVLTYFRWYWKEGDGWVALNSAMHDAIKKARPDILTWHDPAVRVAPVYGSGGRLDMIGNWSYTNPDPIRIGLTTEELLTMAQGRQKVFQMIQAIWYRSRTAPKDRRVATERAGAANPWDDHDPDADYITPSPAHMTEGFWTAISRPIRMIGYHGTGSLLAGFPGAYKLTHKDTADALGRVHGEVLQPFGPMLLQIGSRPADVAFLESFASQIFAQQGTFGQANGNIGAFWLASQYAGIQSDIVYEETIMECGLDAYKLLVLPSCVVLPRSVFEKIVAFQQRGGIVLSDDLIAPALKSDIVIPHCPVAALEGEPWKSATLAIGAQMRKALQGKYTPFAQSENPEVVLYTRERDGVQYLFAINDRRQFGDYVGRYRMVMEDGLPAETTITVQRAGVKVIDLVAGKEVPVESSLGVTRFRANLEPGGGKIFVIADRLPASVAIMGPERMDRGKTATFDISFQDASGAPVAPVVPFEIRIEDPAFRSAEPSGFYAAVGGKARVTFDLAENERTGVWRVVVTERIKGVSETLYIRVR